MNATVDYNTLTVIVGGVVFWTGTVIAIVMWLNGQFNKLHFRLIKVELRLDLVNGRRLTADEEKSASEF